MHEDPRLVWEKARQIAGTSTDVKGKCQGPVTALNLGVCPRSGVECMTGQDFGTDVTKTGEGMGRGKIL